MTKLQTFSHYGIATLANHPSLQRFIAIQAALHYLTAHHETAQTRAASLAVRQAREITDGPKASTDLTRLLSSAATESALDSCDPMTSLPAVLEQRGEEFHTRQRESMPQWLDTVVSPITSHGAESQLTQVLAKRALSRLLADASTKLRADQAANVAEMSTSEEFLRQRTTAILRANRKPSKEGNQVLYSPRMVFSAITALFILIAFIFEVLASVPFVPLPFGMILLGIVVASVFTRRKVNLADLKPGEDLQPFLPLRTQFVAYAQVAADNQKLGWKVEAIDLARETLDCIQIPESLTERLQAAQSLLNQQEALIPDSFWAGGAPTFGGLTGRQLVMMLWEARKQRWLSAEFERHLREVGGVENIENLLITHSPESATKILCRAAERYMEPVTFVESVQLVLQTVPEGKQSLIGEISSQIGLLKGLLTIQSYKVTMVDPACPLLVHIVLPAALEARLKPALIQALPDETLDFYTTAEDTQIRILVESFNRSNAERSSYLIYANAIHTHAEQAEREMWSAFGPLIPAETSLAMEENSTKRIVPLHDAEDALAVS